MNEFYNIELKLYGIQCNINLNNGFILIILIESKAPQLKPSTMKFIVKYTLYTYGWTDIII